MRSAWRACGTRLEAGAPPLFPPQEVAAVKALACELPARSGVPLSRFSLRGLARQVVLWAVVGAISAATAGRWLRQDALRPWRYRSWIFPRDPTFESKAARVLDLYEGRWEGVPLGPKEYVLSADEKTSIQARVRLHPSAPPAPGEPMRVEHEYERGGSLVYLAAWDVHRAKLFGRCETKTGIVPFDPLVEQVMSQTPYCSAERVFLIVDNGSSHRGRASVERLQARWPNLALVHLPVHASWLNQIEIYFSIVQRQVLTPNDFARLAEVESRLLDVERRYEAVAKPFRWTFTRQDLAEWLEKLNRVAAPPEEPAQPVQSGAPLLARAA
jgi:hypothetical protein